MKHRPFKLGIVGGLGARAGVDTLAALVKLNAALPADTQREIYFEQKAVIEKHPPLSVEYSPLHRKFYVYECLKKMADNGCNAALIPCFISQTFIEELREEVDINLLSLSHAIREYLELNHPGHHRIGVLTTPYVRKKNLIKSMIPQDYELLYPPAESETSMLKTFYDSSSFSAEGRLTDAAQSELVSTINSLIELGATMILPAITDLAMISQELRQICRIPILPVNQIYAHFAHAATLDSVKKKAFKIGVIGGVGPAATVDFFAKIIAQTHAKKDQDHIKILIEQNPQIPDRTANLIADGADPTLAIYSTARKLVRGGADIVAIPCNTAHAYVERIQNYLDVPIINMLSVTAASISQLPSKPQKIGLLATSGTLRSQIYQQALESVNLQAITPSAQNQDKVMQAIYGPTGVKAGFTSGRCTQLLEEVIIELSKNGAEVIILACTELPLISLPARITSSITLIDPTRELAKKCVEISESFADTDTTEPEQTYRQNNSTQDHINSY